jgi:tetratricopeptide (TPR) repeat protein
MLDSANVEARIWFAIANAVAAGTAMSDDRDTLLTIAESAANHAHALAPSNSLVHACLCWVYMFSNRANEAISEGDHALMLDPNQTWAHSGIATAKMFAGRSEETESQILHLLRLSPCDSYLWQWHAIAGTAKLNLGETEAALRWLRMSIEANPVFPLAHLYLAAALMELDRESEARQAVKTLSVLDPTLTVRRFEQTRKTQRPVYMAQFRRVAAFMRKAGVPERDEPAAIGAISGRPRSMIRCMASETWLARCRPTWHESRHAGFSQPPGEARAPIRSTSCREDVGTWTPTGSSHFKNWSTLSLVTRSTPV